VLLAAKSFFDSTGAAVAFMLILVAGYAVCFGLWWFVFRKPREDEERRPTVKPPPDE
jgi:nitrate/nitrite transporter NarK